MSGFDPLAAAAMGSLVATVSEAEAALAEPSFYEELRDGFAKDMVAQFNTGTVVLLKPNLSQGADPHNAFADAAATRVPRNAVVLGFPAHEIRGNVLHSDRRIILDAADFNDNTRPAGDDDIEIDGKLHAIVDLAAIPAAGPAVIYIIQARTGGAG